MYNNITKEGDRRRYFLEAHNFSKLGSRVDGLRDHPVDEDVAFGLKRRPRRCVRRDVFINQPAYDNLILSLVVTITAERRFGRQRAKKSGEMGERA